MENLTKQDEKRVVVAIERAVKLANEGSSPDEALLKVAQEEQLKPEMVKRIVEAFNTSKTLAHLKHASEDTRADSFDIASAETILGKLYPAEIETPTKKAAAGLHPDYCIRDLPNFNKAAEMELPALTEEKAELELSPVAASIKAAKERNRFSQLLKEAEDTFREVFMKLWSTTKQASDYWRRAANTENFAMVEKRAYATYGPPVRHVMDMIFEMGDLGSSRLAIKRAAAEELGTQQMYFNPDAEPYSFVADAMLLAKTATCCRQAVHAIKKAMADHAYANLFALPQPVVEAEIDWMLKNAKRNMPGFTEQDRPEGVKSVYKALKRDHPGMPAGMKARIASRQGKPGKQEQGPPYKGPLSGKKKAALDDLFGKEGQGLAGITGGGVMTTPAMPPKPAPGTPVPVPQQQVVKNPLALPNPAPAGSEGMGGKGTGGVAPAATPANQQITPSA